MRSHFYNFWATLSSTLMTLPITFSKLISLRQLGIVNDDRINLEFGTGILGTMSSTRKDTNDYLKMSVAITGIFGYRFQFGTGILIKLVYTPIIFPVDLTSDLGDTRGLWKWWSFSLGYTF